MAETLERDRRGEYTEKRGREEDDDHTKEKMVEPIRSVKPKLMSVVGAVVSASRMDRSDSSRSPRGNTVIDVDRKSPRSARTEDNIPIDYPIEKPLIQEIHQQTDVKNRNKRMFAGLMGHLGQARRALESDSAKIERQTTLKEVAKNKNLEESKKVAELRRLAAEEERKKDKISRDMKLLQSRIDDLKKKTEVYKSTVKSFENFLLTSTEPGVMWLPIRHNDTTKALLDRREGEVLALIDDRIAADKEVILKLEADFTLAHSIVPEYSVTVSSHGNKDHDHLRRQDSRNALKDRDSNSSNRDSKKTSDNNGSNSDDEEGVVIESLKHDQDERNTEQNSNASNNSAVVSSQCRTDDDIEDIEGVLDKLDGKR